MLNFENITEHDLLVSLKESRADAFEEIFNRYWLKLYCSSCKKIKNKEVSEEIVQDVFTALWLNRETLNIRDSLGAYLYTAIRYRVINHIKKEIIRNAYKEKMLIVSDNLDTSLEENILLNDLNRNLEREIKYLPEKCRSVFELSRKQHKSNREIAEFLHISEKTVENHLTKAIRRLRVGLEEVSRLAIYLTISLFLE
ncbi:MAG: RNA polymerase sigma-70 factor [Flavobacterium sp.]|nr:RNA polymerase sigma-70 factor [Pedobacter sp.]